MSKMRELIEKLKVLNRIDLAKELEKTHDLSVLDYSRYLFSYSTSIPLEKQLTHAFRKELTRLSYPEHETNTIIERLSTTRVIQMAPHLVPYQGARMLAIDWQSSVGLTSDEYYIVGMYSGIPFSNSFYPGALTYHPKYQLADLLEKESSIYKEHQKIQNGNSIQKFSLVPAVMQDELVYQSAINEKTRNTVLSMTPRMQEFLHHNSLYEDSYSKWALHAVNKIMSYSLKKEKVAYIDINEVTTEYLIEIFKDTNHVLYKVFFDKYTRRLFQEFFDEVLLIGHYQSGKYLKQERLSIQGDHLVGNHLLLELTPEAITDALESKRICPSTFLCYSVMAFFNGFKCLGSFKQAVYLPEYKRKWFESGLNEKEHITTIPAVNVTTGFLTDDRHHDIRSIDIILGSQWNPDASMKFKELLLSVADHFVE